MSRNLGTHEGGVIHHDVVAKCQEEEDGQECHDEGLNQEAHRESHPITQLKTPEDLVRHGEAEHHDKKEGEAQVRAAEDLYFKFSALPDSYEGVLRFLGGDVLPLDRLNFGDRCKWGGRTAFSFRFSFKCRELILNYHELSQISQSLPRIS